MAHCSGHGQLVLLLQAPGEAIVSSWEKRLKEETAGVSYSPSKVYLNDLKTRPPLLKVPLSPASARMRKKPLTRGSLSDIYLHHSNSHRREDLSGQEVNRKQTRDEVT